MQMKYIETETSPKNIEIYEPAPYRKFCYEINYSFFLLINSVTFVFSKIYEDQPSYDQANQPSTRGVMV